MTLATTSERIGKDQVKLTVEVPESELNGAISAAYRRWASEIKVPGFRKGKVPRQLIDARVGPEVVREEALRDALPDFYREALKAESIEAIAPPEIEVTKLRDRLASGVRGHGGRSARDRPARLLRMSTSRPPRPKSPTKTSTSSSSSSGTGSRSSRPHLAKRDAGTTSSSTSRAIRTGSR